MGAVEEIMPQDVQNKEREIVCARGDTQMIFGRGD
jgi:hypothetical protein